MKKYKEQDFLKSIILDEEIKKSKYMSEFTSYSYQIIINEINNNLYAENIEKVEQSKNYKNAEDKKKFLKDYFNLYIDSNRDNIKILIEKKKVEFSSFLSIYFVKNKLYDKNIIIIDEKNFNLENNENYKKFIEEYITFIKKKEKEEEEKKEKEKEEEEIQIKNLKYEKNFKNILKEFEYTKKQKKNINKINKNIKEEIKKELEKEKKLEKELEKDLIEEIENLEKEEEILEKELEEKIIEIIEIKETKNEKYYKKNEKICKEKYKNYKEKCNIAFNTNIDNLKTENDINVLLNNLNECIEDRKYVKNNCIKNPDIEHNYIIELFEKKKEFFEIFLLEKKINY